MSNMTEAQARNENLYVLLEKPTVAYRDELLHWATLPSAQLLRRFKAMFKTDFSFASLTHNQVSTIKGILHPEVAIKEIPAKQTSANEGSKADPPQGGADEVSIGAIQHHKVYQRCSLSLEFTRSIDCRTLFTINYDRIRKWRHVR